MRKQKRKHFFLIFITLLLLFVPLYFIVNNIKDDLIREQISLYLQNTRNDLQQEITAQTQKNLDIAILLSQDLPLLESIYKNDSAKISRKFQTLLKTNTNYNGMWFHIIDAKGYSRFRSWSPLRNDHITAKRKDLAKLIKKPHVSSSISVGKFNLTMKGIAPLYHHGKFLGLIEIITHFNRLSNYTDQLHIYSAIVIDKSFSKQLSVLKHKDIIAGYHLANHLSPALEAFIKTQTMASLLSIDKERFIKPYYITLFPIFNISHKKVASYLVFVPQENLKGLTKTADYFSLIINITMAIILIYLIYTFGLKIYVNKIEINQDVLEHEVQKKTLALKELFYIDPLTHTFNRLKLEEDYRKDRSQTLILLNIDNFSYINAAYGFKFGDQILLYVVEMLSSLSEQSLYRINGDEFALLCKNYDTMITQVKELFAELIVINDIQLKVTFSFGIFWDKNTHIDSAIRKAEVALKEAKKRGKNRLVVYKKALKHSHRTYIESNQLIVQALSAEKLTPYFQAIYDNKNETIYKYESLARVTIDNDVYLPYQFLEAAKIGGFLSELTYKMVEASFEKLQSVSADRPDIEISINITEDDLQNDLLISYLPNLCNTYQIKPKQVTLEILEGISADGSKNHIHLLQKLKTLGFNLAIDDFGVEYSNFERIAQLDVDFIKIDGKYIKDIDTNLRHRKIVEAIVYFAKTMSIATVAEYVHSESVQKIVLELGIDYSQGYLFSEPKPDFLID